MIRCLALDKLGFFMKKLTSLLTLFIFSTSLFASDLIELKGELLTSYGASFLSSIHVDGYHTVAIREDNGGIQEVLVPQSESERFYHRFAGKPAIAEVIQVEGVDYPVVQNLALLFSDTQVTYWKNATQPFFSFPQEQANADLENEVIAGVVRYDESKVNRYASGFSIHGLKKEYQLAKMDRKTTYMLKSLLNQAATFTLGQAKTYKVADATEEEEKLRKSLKQVDTLIKPTQVGSLAGDPSRYNTNGIYYVSVSLGEDKENVVLTSTSRFYSEFGEEKLTGATLSLKYRLTYSNKGLISLVESYEVIKQSPKKYDEESHSYDDIW